MRFSRIFRSIFSFGMAAAFCFVAGIGRGEAQGFGLPVLVPTGNQPVFVATADVNGDKIPDLIYIEAGATAAASTTHVLLGDGKGGFTPSAVLQTGGSTLAIGDLMGAGNVDIAWISTQTSGDLQDVIATVAPGNGTGSYSSTQTIGSAYVRFAGSAPPTWTNLLAARMTKSGGVKMFYQLLSSFLTYVVADPNPPGPQQLLMGNNSPFPGESGPLTVVDLNGDGFNDFVMLSTNLHRADVLLNHSDTLMPTALPTYYLGSSGVYSLLVQDFNGDGIPDLAVEGSLGRIEVLPGNGDGTFGTSSIGGTMSVDDTQGDGGTLIVATDLNGDKIPDLLTFSPAGVSVELGTASGNFNYAGSYTAGTGAGANGQFVTADFNGDGVLDVAMDAPRGIAILYGTPTPATGESLIANPEPSSYGSAFTLTATLPAGSGGTIAFAIDGTSVGTSNVGSTGTATWTVPAGNTYAAGPHSLTGTWHASGHALAVQISGSHTIGPRAGASNSGIERRQRNGLRGGDSGVDFSGYRQRHASAHGDRDVFGARCDLDAHLRRRPNRQRCGFVYFRCRAAEYGGKSRAAGNQYHYGGVQRRHQLRRDHGDGFARGESWRDNGDADAGPADAGAGPVVLLWAADQWVCDLYPAGFAVRAQGNVGAVEQRRGVCPGAPRFQSICNHSARMGIQRSSMRGTMCGSSSTTADRPTAILSMARAIQRRTRSWSEPDTTTASALSSSMNPAPLGTAVTFTVTLTGNAAVPTGTVQFLDGTTLLGTGTLNAAGQASFTTSTLTVGTHPITAVYAATLDFNGVTSAVLPQLITAVADASAVTLTSSVNPSIFGQSVTFTAAASVPGPFPFLIQSGTMTFLDGATVIGTGAINQFGRATFTTSTLAVGSHAITASYPGGTSPGGQTIAPSVSAVLTQVVDAAMRSAPPGFTLTVAPDPVTLKPGNTGILLVTVTALSGFSQPVALSCTGTNSSNQLGCGFIESTIPVGGGATTLDLVTTAPYPCGGNPTQPYARHGDAALVLPSCGVRSSPGAKLQASGWRTVGMGGAMVAALVWIWPRRRRRWASLLALVMLGGVLGLSGCGTCTNLGTTPGSYDVTVVATAGNVTQSVVVKVNVLVP